MRFRTEEFVRRELFCDTSYLGNVPFQDTRRYDETLPTNRGYQSTLYEQFGKAVIPMRNACAVLKLDHIRGGWKRGADQGHFGLWLDVALYGPRSEYQQ